MFIKILAKIVDPDQTAHDEQSDLDLQCLLWLPFQICGKAMVDSFMSFSNGYY